MLRRREAEGRFCTLDLFLPTDPPDEEERLRLLSDSTGREGKVGGEEEEEDSWDVDEEADIGEKGREEEEGKGRKGLCKEETVQSRYACQCVRCVREKRGERRREREERREERKNQLPTTLQKRTEKKTSEVEKNIYFSVLQ
jgi:hypothetical protein